MNARFRSQPAARASAFTLAVVIVLALAPVGSTSHDFRTDDLAYTLGFPLPLAGTCDVDAVGTVKFCDALKPGHDYNRFTIFVRDVLAQPIGATFVFHDDTGEEVDSGSFCGNHFGFVPAGARVLYVTPGVFDDTCGWPAVSGDVVVTWRHGNSIDEA